MVETVRRGRDAGAVLLSCRETTEPSPRLIAAVENGFCAKDTDITVKLMGGDLIIRYTDDRVFMTGDATKCFDGVVEV